MRTIVRWNHSYLKGIEKPLPTILEISHAAVLLIWVNIYPWLTAKLSPFGSWASSALFLCRKLRGLSSYARSPWLRTSPSEFSSFQEWFSHGHLSPSNSELYLALVGPMKDQFPRLQASVKRFLPHPHMSQVGVTGVRVLWALTLLIYSPGLQPLCSCNLLQTRAGWPARSLG